MKTLQKEGEKLRQTEMLEGSSGDMANEVLHCEAADKDSPRLHVRMG